MKGTALLKYLYSNYWAITPTYLDTMQTALTEWCSEGGTVETSQEIKPSTPFTITPSGVAILAYSGAFHKRLLGTEALSGGISGERLIRDLKACAENKDIKSVVLSLDTPGGTVDGVADVTSAIKDLRAVKPIVTYADGLLASAGVWIGATSDAIVCNSTAQVGSIGVIMVHQEASKAEEASGVVSTVLTAGKYKGDGNRHEPLSAQARSNLQDSLDFYYSMFVDHVATSRGVTIASCLASMAEGRMFIGTQALESGLVDKIGNLETAINLSLTLGGYNVKTELKEALASMDTNELLATLAGNTALPESVTSVIDSIVESKEEVTIMKSEYDTLTTKLTASVETITSLTEANATLKAELETLTTELTDLKEASKVSSAREAITSQFDAVGYEAEESVITSLLAMDNAQPMIDSILGLHNSKANLASGLTTSTGLSDSDSTPAPLTMDEAVNKVKLELDCDIDSAITEASVRYPELFKRS